MSPGARDGKAIAGIETTERLYAGLPVGPGRYDAACPAEARVQVIRSPDQQLAFCQHHFREHMVALITGGWQQVG